MKKFNEQQIIEILRALQKYEKFYDIRQGIDVLVLRELLKERRWL